MSEISPGVVSKINNLCSCQDRHVTRLFLTFTLQEQKIKWSKYTKIIDGNRNRITHYIYLYVNTCT